MIEPLLVIGILGALLLGLFRLEKQLAAERVKTKELEIDIVLAESELERAQGELELGPLDVLACREADTRLMRTVMQGHVDTLRFIDRWLETESKGTRTWMAHEAIEIPSGSYDRFSFQPCVSFKIENLAIWGAHESDIHVTEIMVGQQCCTLQRGPVPWKTIQKLLEDHEITATAERGNMIQIEVQNMGEDIALVSSAVFGSLPNGGYGGS